MSNLDGDFGLAQQATYVKKIREEARLRGDYVIVLSGGDINTGAPESNLFKAKPDIEAMNEIGYEAMVLGNHEFDITPEMLKEQQKMAKFEFIAANIKNADGTDAFKPYITKTFGDKKIAIIGLTTPDTPSMSAKINRPGLVWENPFIAQKKLVEELKESHDMVIALSHMGYYANETHGVAFPGDETMAKKMPELDVIIGGHTHSQLEKPVQIGNTSIVQAKSEGQFMGRIEIDLSLPKPKMTDYELVPIKNMVQDPDVLKITNKYMQAAKAQLEKKIGQTLAEFKGGRATLESVDSPLGNFVSQAHKDATGADFSFTNGRGLRAGLPKGNISLRELLSVSPFGNKVTTAELNGAEVWKTVEIIHKNYISTPGENIYFSENFHIVMEDKKIKAITLNGRPIPNTATGKYKIATGDFLTEIVPEFKFIKEHPSYKNTGILEVESMESYFKAHPVITPKAYNHKTLHSPTDRNCGQLLLNSLRLLGH